MKKLFISLVVSFNLISIAEAQEESSDWKIFGQVQLRSELDARDFSNTTNPFSFSSLRTRLGFNKLFLID